MAGKTGKMVSLEAIEEHLKSQDKEIKQSTLLTLEAVGGAVILAGLSFVTTSIFPDPARAYYGLFLIVFGALFMILVGSFWNKIFEMN
jgi:hypothetical protein